MDILYHEGKANVVADALSWKSVHAGMTLLSLMQLQREFKAMGIYMIMKGDKVSDLTLEPELY